MYSSVDMDWLQRAEVRCSIETHAHLSLVARDGALQRAEVRCSIETWILAARVENTRRVAARGSALLY